MRIRGFLQQIALLLAGVAILFLAGCATPKGEESDLPWNMPQPWETGPAIPGMDGSH
jgi:hypothetical protein